jgi:hypothetical protein
MKRFNLIQLPDTGFRVPGHRKLPRNHPHAIIGQPGYGRSGNKPGTRDRKSGTKILINKHIKFRFLVPIQQNRMSNQCGFALTDVR